ncbi:hypothetical protein EOD41_14505 [Mucilaginibacter limnophilus]|uniref:Lipocalin-like domain-containing protein n=1 Tax=Mucilaginibacter limnophilus TaxID=1932778 RepID=A0A437MRA3_9SPHI|nr:DUF5004 domain-containing protein [Mucilaginibacter limnophilus]RVU00168.1 hypothetical protein EOD41_14505 [Mucilaginibacter limnophilus]
MKRRNILFLIIGLAVISLYNSCKKDELSTIDALVSSGTWELASLQVFNYVGDTKGKTDTLYRDCDFKQLFKFNADKTCTYSNYSCLEQTTTGKWSLSKDKLFLLSDIACDTSETESIQPFTNTKIVTLGQYSMVLQTGDLQTNYPANQRRRIVQYGFVKQRNK